MGCLIEYIVSHIKCFSFLTLVPILQILFKLNNKAFEFIPWDTAGVSFKEILYNNCYYYISEMIGFYGPSLALLLLGIFLASMTLLKTGTYFLSSAVMIPIRTGVVRDIRNQLYKKILYLPLGFSPKSGKGIYWPVSVVTYRK